MAAIAIEISFPLSAEVIAPTCLVPRLATTLTGVWTVVNPDKIYLSRLFLDEVDNELLY